MSLANVLKIHHHLHNYYKYSMKMIKVIHI